MCVCVRVHDTLCVLSDMEDGTAEDDGRGPSTQSAGHSTWRGLCVSLSTASECGEGSDEHGSGVERTCTCSSIAPS